VTEQVANTCTFDSAVKGCLLPTGGLTSWEASLEVRIKLIGPLSTAVFGDAADVSPYVANVRFARPHFSAGLGLRYDTPVGPIRLDIASRIPNAQYFEAVSDIERAGEDPGTILGLPVAIAVGIGEAF
jgi:outer membrane protein assembly factor BamA